MSDELIYKIFEKVEKIAEDVGELKVTAAKNEEVTKYIAKDVEHHVKRSDMLEDLYREIKEKDIEPIKEDINKFKGIVKFITIMASLGSLITLCLKFFGLV